MECKVTLEKNYFQKKGRVSFTKRGILKKCQNQNYNEIKNESCTSKQARRKVKVEKNYFPKNKGSFTKGGILKKYQNQK